MAKNIQNNASISDDTNPKSGNKIKLIFSTPTQPGPKASITIDCDRLIDISQLTLDSLVRVYENGFEEHFDIDASCRTDKIGEKIAEILRASIVNNDQRSAVIGLIRDAIDHTIDEYRSSSKWSDEELKKYAVVKDECGPCTCEVID